MAVIRGSAAVELAVEASVVEALAAVELVAEASAAVGLAAVQSAGADLDSRAPLVRRDWEVGELEAAESADDLAAAWGEE